MTFATGPTTLTARCPDDLLAMVPVVMGFEPADSIVMLTVVAPRAFHARVDLPADLRGVREVVDVLVEPAVRHHVREVVLLLYTADDELARAVVRRVRGVARRGGPGLVEALRADRGHWFPLLRDRGGADAETGVPYDVASHPFVVEAVVAGRVLHRSREELEATLQPDPAGVAAVEAARGPERLPAAWVRDALARWVGEDDPPPGDVAAGLLAAVAEPAAREAAWQAVTRPDAGQHARFWAGLVPRAPDDLVAGAASLLALCSWVAGDGALAWCGVDRAHEVDAEHPLARLVADLLTGAVPPTAWEVVREAIAAGT